MAIDLEYTSSARVSMGGIAHVKQEDSERGHPVYAADAVRLHRCPGQIPAAGRRYRVLPGKKVNLCQEQRRNKR